VVVVDGSEESIESLIRSCRRSFPVEYVRHRPPSAAAQRNAGIERLLGRYSLIGLLDDDILLAPDAIERMLEFWGTDESSDVAGASFNQQGQETVTETGFFKRSRFSDALGLYCRTPGGVARSGWQALIGTAWENTSAEWIPTTAAVWRAEVLERHGFDEFFHSYSYLEDLDFSYGISKRHRLMVVANARYEHHTADGGRVDDRSFGRIETRNRLYFVRKHGLSLGRCFAGLAVRWAMTLGGAVKSRDRALWQRAVGNLEGIAEHVGCGEGRTASIETQSRR
jgi:GT2 family glycosyltransferase